MDPSLKSPLTNSKMVQDGQMRHQRKISSRAGDMQPEQLPSISLKKVVEEPTNTKGDDSYVSSKHSYIARTIHSLNGKGGKGIYVHQKPSEIISGLNQFSSRVERPMFKDNIKADNQVITDSRPRVFKVSRQFFDDITYTPQKLRKKQKGQNEAIIESVYGSDWKGKLIKYTEPSSEITKTENHRSKSVNIKIKNHNRLNDINSIYLRSSSSSSSRESSGANQLP